MDTTTAATGTRDHPSVPPPTPAPATGPPAHDWREAGEAWGRRANDWACLYEHYSSEVVAAIHHRIWTGPGTRLLDIACGAGGAMRYAGSLGAMAAGIDAAAELIAIARDRLPDADLRVGSMFDLPWGDGTFDAATAINGIWGGCDGAVDEAFRVLRPGGWFAMSFWGRGRPLDLRPCMKVFARLAPPAHLDSMRRLDDIAVPGVAEAMLAEAGFELVERGRRISLIEWPDAETAWRAVASVGPAVPALEHAGVDAVRRAVLEAIEPCRDGRGIYRFRNDHHYVVARKPGGAREGVDR